MTGTLRRVNVRRVSIDIRDAYRRALDAFGQRVHLIRPGQWEVVTPCVDWDVRALVNHLVNENLWAPELLAGRTVGEVGDVFDGDLLHDDPIKAFDTSAHDAVQAAFAEGALERTVHLSFGDVPGAEYVTELFADALIHTWDLSQAIGVADRLDPELVDACANWFAGAEEAYRQSGVIGEHADVPVDADPQTRLLAAWGRRA
ncbi:TIGR03086 family protein [Acrocarpospora phusangensis]|uniref:TIGR03086 family protein n=1 Tax=Acrocarpospora phusangensis TaxID=1070424 RepID=A0A919UQY7_9ACTN|nr:TIGR03086 family protein [Acrocarpospora phusangensis]